MEPETDTVRPEWLTWPAGVVALLAWGLGHLTHIALFDLIAVAALTWLGGWLLCDFLARCLIRTGQVPQPGQDPPETDRP
jgi:hypothetical protein